MRFVKSNFKSMIFGFSNCCRNRIGQCDTTPITIFLSVQPCPTKLFTRVPYDSPGFKGQGLVSTKRFTDGSINSRGARKFPNSYKYPALYSNKQFLNCFKSGTNWFVDGHYHQTSPLDEQSINSHLDSRYTMGLIPTKKNLELCDKVTASSFCRRRLPVIMVKSQMAETLRLATQFIEQGHVRVGTEMITDPAFLVTRNMEDFVTWVNSSAIRKHVLQYNDMRDDFDLMM